MDGGCGASEIVNLIDLDIEREGDVVAHELETGVIQQVRDVAPSAGKIIVHAQDFVPIGYQAITQV